MLTRVQGERYTEYWHEVALSCQKVTKRYDLGNAFFPVFLYLSLYI
ncbi:MAG: hypothetical protein AAFQ40_06740 [Cyanobacteria bacterium J06623_5]